MKRGKNRSWNGRLTRYARLIQIRRGVRRILLLISRVDDRGLLAAAEAGVTGVIRRSEATAGNLAAAIRSAAAD
jgi:DNA-binding NarL/FixJ family response regulator